MLPDAAIPVKPVVSEDSRPASTIGVTLRAIVAQEPSAEDVCRLTTNLGVVLTDATENTGIRLVSEMGSGIAAEEGKGVLRPQLLPQRLQTARSVEIAFLGKELHKLAVNAQTTGAGGPETPDKAADRIGEPLPVGLFLVHDGSARQLGVEDDQASLFLRYFDGKSSTPQPSRDEAPVAHPDQHEHPVARSPAVTQKSGERICERVRRVEQLNDVRAFGQRGGVWKFHDIDPSVNRAGYDDGGLRASSSSQIRGTAATRSTGRRQAYTSRGYAGSTIGF